MQKAVKIKDILTYLTENSIDFEFIGNEKKIIKGYSTLFNYKNETMTFVSTLNKFTDYENSFNNIKIELIFTGFDEQSSKCFDNQIKVEYPKRTFFSILEKFYNSRESTKIFAEKKDYEKFSFVSENAQLFDNVQIGIGCVIEDNVTIGKNTIIHHNVVIRKGTKIGNNCTICSGTIIGETGFNPLRDNQNERTIVTHYGGVNIGDNVHIGDNCSISKGTIDDTVIKNGVKLNKQVIVAHNVVINEHTVVTSPTFICGSVKIGKGCHIAATTIRNQCTIGDHATLGLGSVVVKDVEAGQVVVGNPAKPLKK